MTPRFNLYFAEDEADLLKKGKKEIDNLSDFFKTALRDRLETGNRKDTPVEKIDIKKIFDKKFADFQNEADVRNVFEDSIGAEQALKNRLSELKRAYPNEFLQIKELFRARYPRYAKITDEL